MATWDDGVGRDMIRAGCGAALFGVPLLYTMELWWTGTGSSPAFSLGLLAAVLVAATVIDRTAGFRFAPERSWSSSLVDGVEVTGICIAVAAVVLVVIGEITPQTNVRESMSKVIAQLVPLVIGASIANEIFGNGSATPAEPGTGSGSGARQVGSLLGGAFVGAIVVALAIAPTDEVTIIAGRASLAHLLALIAVSLVASHGIVFSADFAGSSDLRRQRHLDELAHTALAYIVALIAAGVMLALYGRLTGVSVLTSWSRVIALGFPAAIGAAAGRLAL